MTTENKTTIIGEVTIDKLCAALDANNIRFCVTADEHQIPSHFGAWTLGNEEIGNTRIHVYGEDEEGYEIDGHAKIFYRNDNLRVDIIKWNNGPTRGVALYDEDGNRHEFYFLTAFSL